MIHFVLRDPLILITFTVMKLYESDNDIPTFVDIVARKLPSAPVLDVIDMYIIVTNNYQGMFVVQPYCRRVRNALMSSSHFF